MPLSSGTRLGSYEVLAPIGAGGMGEVYKARDSRLNRDVAIKVLPELFATDADRLARFTREAQALAALNHPNIAQIFGIEDSGGSKALVMELVVGDDLSAIIAQGPMPLSDALPVARQIADALEAAHEQGIVHRDLKPQNIKVRADGAVKVLDFGLAKAADPAGSISADLANSPTLTARATQMGMIIGTAAYMAPEQAKGRAVDKRADIWAFGAVLYEMLTGRRAFEGDDITEVLASVLKTDPAWTSMPADTPPSVRRLLRRCLEKDPKKRLSSISDARLELDEQAEASATPPAASSAAPTPVVAPPRSARWIWPVATAVLLIVAVVAARQWPSTSATSSEVLARVSIVAPSSESLYPDTSGVALSPDGTMVAFLTGTISHSRLWVRRLDSLSAQAIEGSDTAQVPFWSPDSTHVGFFTNSQIKAVAVSGGRPEVLADAPNGRGATWNANNTILFAPDATGPILRVSGSGGNATPVTTLDKGRKESGHRFPHFLPDGDHFLYAVLPGKNGKFDIFVGSLSKPADRTFIAALETAPIYAPPGYLIYGKQGAVTAVPFDVKSLKITGDAVSLPDQPAAILDPKSSWTAGPAASLSRTGMLAYYSSPSMNATLAWMNRDGKITGTINVPPGPIDWARLSPDATQAALVRSTSPSESTIWVADLLRGSVAPLTSGHGRNDDPVWSPDGTRIAFSSDRNGAQDIMVKTVGDAAPESVLHHSDALFKGPDDWSPDGKTLIMSQLDADTAQNLYALPAAGGEPTSLIRGPLRDVFARFSSDGKWFLYASEDTGQFQLVAVPFPVSGRAVRISQGGGVFGWWSKDDREIVYASNDYDTLWKVDVTPGPALQVSAPRQIAKLPPGLTFLQATRDLQRFLVVMPERTGPGSITLVEHWRAALDAKR